MKKVQFEWDEDKDVENRTNHDVPFSLAQRAFLIHIVSLLKMWSTAAPKTGIIALVVSAKGS